MALVAAQTAVAAGTNEVSITPSASDTISGNDIVPGGGLLMVVVTTGTATTATVADPNLTASGNPGTVTGVTTSATGRKLVLIPTSAVSPSTNLATVTFSGALTGVTYLLIKF